jgi:hypothetical protein
MRLELVDVDVHVRSYVLRALCVIRTDLCRQVELAVLLAQLVSSWYLHDTVVGC